jgi:hypothetical protein
MTSLQEYDLKSKLVNIAKGQGLCKLVTKAMDSKNQLNEGWQEEPTLYAQQPPYISTLDNSWYNDLK